MLQDQPSRTARRAALRRAAHQLWDNPRVFEDPIALKIISRDDAAELSGTRASDPLLQSLNTLAQTIAVCVRWTGRKIVFHLYKF